MKWLLLDGRELTRARADLEDLGLCRQAGADADAWTTGSRQRPNTPAGRRTSALKARKQCHGCPVKATCVLAALTEDEHGGIWGGFMPWEIRTIRQALNEVDSGTATVIEVRREINVVEQARLDHDARLDSIRRTEQDDKQDDSNHLAALLTERFGHFEGAA